MRLIEMEMVAGGMDAYQSQVWREWESGGSTWQFFSRNCRFDRSGIAGLGMLGGQRAWGVSGLDPARGFAPVTDWMQCKPEKPVVFPSGKEAKYVGPSRQNVRANRAIVVDPSVASWANPPKDRPVVLVEGVKKAATVDRLGFLSVSCIGVWNFTQPGDNGGWKLVDELQALVELGHKQFLISYDADDKKTARAAVSKARERLTVALQEAGCTVTAASWSSALGKGIDDVWAIHGDGVVMEILLAAKPVGPKGRVAFAPVQNHGAFGTAIYNAMGHGWGSHCRTLTASQKRLYKAQVSAAEIEAELSGRPVVMPQKPVGEGPLSDAVMAALGALDEMSMIPERNGTPFGIQFDAAIAGDLLRDRFAVSLGKGFDVPVASLPFVAQALARVASLTGLRFEADRDIRFDYLLKANDAGLTFLCNPAESPHGSCIWAKMAIYQKRALKACGDYRRIGSAELGPTGHLPTYSNQAGVRLTAIKAPMGSGKTYSMIDYVARFDGSVTYLVHRAGLCESSAEVLDLETREGHGRNGRKVAACIEQFKAKTALGLGPSFCKDGLILCDEIRAIFLSIASSSTMTGERTRVVEAFAESLRCAKQIILLDAGLTANEIIAIQELAGISPAETRILDYTAKRFTGRTAYLYQHYDTAESALLESVKTSAKSGIPTWEASDALGHLSRGIKTIRGRAAAVQDLLGGQVKIAEISSVTRATTDHPDFGLEQQHHLLLQRTLIQASPSVDAGLSVKADNTVANVFGLFSGVSRSDAQQQMLERVRFGCDRHIYLDTKQMLVGHGSSSLAEEEAAAAIREAILALDTMEVLRESSLPDLAKAGIRTSDQSPAMAALYRWNAKADAIENMWRSAARENMAFDLLQVGYSVEIVTEKAQPIAPADQRLEAVTKRMISDYEAIANADRDGNASLDSGTEDRMNAARRAALAFALDCGAAPDLDTFEAIALDKKFGVISNQLSIIDPVLWKERNVFRLINTLNPMNPKAARDLNHSLSVHETLRLAPTLYGLIASCVEYNVSDRVDANDGEGQFIYKSGDDWTQRVYAELKPIEDRLTALRIRVPTSPHDISRTIKTFLRLYGISQSQHGINTMGISAAGRISSLRSFIVNQPASPPAPDAISEPYEVQLTRAVKGLTQRIIAWANTPEGQEARARRIAKRAEIEAVASAAVENAEKDPDEF